MRTSAIVFLLVCIALLDPIRALACPGDCGIDGAVTVEELILGVNVALGAARVDRCFALDANADAAVTIEELVAAVNNALAGCPAPQPRLIALSRDGRIASLDLASPFTVRKSAALGSTIASARCRAGRCLIVHAEESALSLVAADDLARGEPILLEPGSDPRDVAFVADDVAVVSLHHSAELVVIDLARRTQTAIDLQPVADADGIPEALRLAACGRQVFVQLQRIDDKSGLPTALGPGLAVVDLDRPAGEELLDADPEKPGTQAIALAGPPNFDMSVDCAAGRLFIAEPEPLMSGGGAFEVVDLDTLSAAEFPIDPGAELGGFAVIDDDTYWLITHTEFGPGPSSHLTFFDAGGQGETHNTFAEEHVNELALDTQANLLFYPDPCRITPTNAGCQPGVHVFAADSGTPLTIVDVGLPPIELAISR